MAMGRFLIVAGVLLILAGSIATLLDRMGLSPLRWLGRLPGDIRFEGEHSRFYFPLATSLLFSALATILLWLFRR